MSSREEYLLSEFISRTGDALQDMRVLIEGAVTLYTEEASPLFVLANQSGNYLAAQVMSTIGTALYALRNSICDLQQDYAEELKREMAAQSSQR